jgi:hypothetical protein
MSTIPMANMNAPQWNKPAVGSPQNGTGGWFDTRIKYWYGLGGIEAVLRRYEFWGGVERKMVPWGLWCRQEEN